MCPRCEGMGRVSDIDRTALYDDSKSLREGALTVPGYSMDGWYGRLFEGMGLPMDTPIASFTARQLDTMLYAPPTKIKVEGVNLTFEGIIPRIQKSMLSKDPEAMQPHVRRFVELAVTFQTCPECAGTRLTSEVLASKVNGENIAELCAMQISDLAAWVRELEEPRGTSRGYGGAPPGLSHRCSRGCGTCSTRSPRSGSVTCRSTGRPARSRAVRRSARR